MTYSEADAEGLLYASLASTWAVLPPGQGQLDARTLENWRFAERVYEPDPRLSKRLEDYSRWLETKAEEDKGQLMEELAALAFGSLKGWDSIKSYSSYAAQYDLVIAGSTLWWFLLMIYLHLPMSGRTIIVEAKNIDKPVSDAMMSRLITTVKRFSTTCHLGVFFTRKGATGYPSCPEGQGRPRRSRVLRDARASATLFHAASQKHIVVLADEDMPTLLKEGGLPRLLEAKIRDNEGVSGLPTTFTVGDKEIDLPPHLAKYFTELSPLPADAMEPESA